MIVVVFVAHGPGRRAEFVLRGVGIIIVLAGLRADPGCWNCQYCYYQ